MMSTMDVVWLAVGYALLLLTARDASIAWGQALELEVERT
jgi:hypothetical protein